MLRYYYKILGLSCLFLFLLSTGCVENEKESQIIMTFSELVNDYNQEINEETKTIRENFFSLEDGDTLIIRDSIHDIIYREVTNDTGIEFTSLLGEMFSISGDITNEFMKGNLVEIHLHIIDVTYKQQNTNTGEIWNFERETLQEGWDLKNNTFLPIPRKYINRVNNENEKKIMTFKDFIGEYNQNIDNETKTITYSFTSLDEGDILIIRDTLDNVTYGEANGYTRIGFVSSQGTSFQIEGDITDEYKKGDEIEIEMHIITDFFTDINPYTGDTWTFEIETIKEGWDDEKHTYIPIPQEYLRQI